MMKKVNKECIKQDDFMLENQRYCMSTFPKAVAFRQMSETIAEALLNALVYDTEDRTLSFGIGRAFYLWKKENYLFADGPEAYSRFHQQLREEVVKKMCNIMKIEDGDNGRDA